LNLTSGTVNFTALSASGNTIYNYTTINIASGVTVVMSAQNLNAPIYWLASGAVTIAGTINLNGQNGASYGQSEEQRSPAYGGSGGYEGGVGGRIQSTPAIPAQPGSGPGGGAAGTTTVGTGINATFAGTNIYLVPLVGGSGGGGAYQPSTEIIGPGGGGGGGAILIASSTSINITGTIEANGGSEGITDSVGAGGGSGGAVHLIAPTVNGGGTVEAYGQDGAANGAIRIEAGTYPNSLSLTPPYTVASTPNLYLPSSSPGAITVVSVNGVSLPATPTGSFVTPDVSINSTAAVPVVINATNIPVGTPLTLQFFSDNGTDFTVPAALTGTLAQSTTTVQVTFPPGFTRGYVTASWLN
jgi:hypothetical protein